VPAPRNRRKRRATARLRVKFKTVDGNWDLVGNNLKIFFIRDAVKFPGHDPRLQAGPGFEPAGGLALLRLCHAPSGIAAHGDLAEVALGIPATYREMEGSSVNTYKLVNERGEAVLAKFSFEPKLGVRNLTSSQAEAIQAKDVGHATRDLYDAIERGDHP
jgi:catalase